MVCANTYKQTKIVNFYRQHLCNVNTLHSITVPFSYLIMGRVVIYVDSDYICVRLSLYTKIDYIMFLSFKKSWISLPPQ